MNHIPLRLNTLLLNTKLHLELFEKEAKLHSLDLRHSLIVSFGSLTDTFTRDLIALTRALKTRNGTNTEQSQAAMRVYLDERTVNMYCHKLSQLSRSAPYWLNGADISELQTKSELFDCLVTAYNKAKFCFFVAISLNDACCALIDDPDAFKHIATFKLPPLENTTKLPRSYSAALNLFPAQTPATLDERNETLFDIRRVTDQLQIDADDIIGCSYFASPQNIVLNVASKYAALRIEHQIRLFLHDLEKTRFDATAICVDSNYPYPHAVKLKQAVLSELRKQLDLPPDHLRLTSK